MRQNEIRNKIEEVKWRLRTLEDGDMLRKHNTILMFPDTGLSLKTTEGGGVAITGAFDAELFTPETANELAAKVTNGNDKAPEPVGEKEFYERTLEILRIALTERQEMGI